MDLAGPFRGSAAVAVGVVTRSVLAGPRYRRLYPDVYLPAEVVVDRTVLSRAAALVVEPDGVLSGYSAAELLGACCAPVGAPPEVTLSRFRNRVPGLVVHRDQLCADEVRTAHGLRLTTPVRTALDLVRWHPVVEGVVAVDALARRHPFGPDDLRALRNRHLGARGTRKVEAVLAMADPRADSPRRAASGSP